MTSFTNSFGGTYSTGTVNLTTGTKALVGTGTSWLTMQIEQGDMFYSGGYYVFIDTVTDNNNIVLGDNWPGATLVGASYTILKTSWTRYDPAFTQAKVRELIARYTALGVLIGVDPSLSAPDPLLGVDTNLALQVNASGQWILWQMVGGVWVLQGSPVGIKIIGNYDPAHIYSFGDAVYWEGSLWHAINGPTSGQQPDLYPAVWMKIVSGGDRYDVWSFDTDRPASGELIGKGYPNGVTFQAGLSDSYANAEVASTATAVYTYKKNGTAFATCTFSAGNAVGAFACTTATSFAKGDILTVFAPATRDATLSGVGMNLVGYRPT